MSKEFEEFVLRQQKENGGYYPAKTMWDAAFTAGRTLGRREMKGQAVDVVRRNLRARDGQEVICLAIEAIPEEVESD